MWYYRISLILLFFCTTSAVLMAEEVKEQDYLGNTAEQHDNDTIYEYHTVYTASVKDGVVQKGTKTYKNRKSITYNSHLRDYPLTFLFTLIYLGIIVGILYHRIEPKIKEVVAPIAIGLLFVGILSWYMISSIIFNTNELVTRLTGTQYEGKVGYSEKWDRGGGRGGGSYRIVAYDYRYTYIHPDSLGRHINVDHTTFSPYRKDKDVKNVTICINEKNGKAALLIPWHTTDNIYYIVIWSLVLNFILLAFRGVLDKPAMKFFDKIEHIRQRRE